MNRPRLFLPSLACAALSLLALPATASAEVRAFSSTGTAQFTSPSTFVGTGNATHLGRYTEAGSLAFSPTTDPAVLHIEGTIVYTAANGDELHAVVAGELNGVTGAVTATVTYVGGTGRFDAAAGSSALTGQLGAGGSVSVSLAGSISY
jgi:hypothetical protein